MGSPIPDWPCEPVPPLDLEGLFSSLYNGVNFMSEPQQPAPCQRLLSTDSGGNRNANEL